MGPKGKACAYRPCPSRTGETTSFFLFPKDSERAAIWLKACLRHDLLDKDMDKLHKNYQLCEKHFEEKYISKGPTRKRLFDQAIPTIFSHILKRGLTDTVTVEEPSRKLNILSDITIVPHLQEERPTVTSGQSFVTTAEDTTINPSLGENTIEITSVQSSFDIAGPSNIQYFREKSPLSPGFTSPSSPLRSPSTATQTSAMLSSDTPRKKKLRRKVRSLRKKNFSKMSPEKKAEWTIEDFNEICDKFLGKPLAEIVKIQAVLKNKKPLARRYSREYKQFALTLYFLGPRAYSFMSKILCLPTKRSLQNITQKLVCRPGLVNDTVFKGLEIKIRTMLEQDKHCILCIDEMSLKSNLFFLLPSI